MKYRQYVYQQSEVYIYQCAAKLYRLARILKLDI